MSTKDIQNYTNKYLFAIILVVSLFFMWGIANNLNDILIKQFSKAFQLTDFQASLVQSAFYFGYFFCAMPAAMFMQRYGYKNAIIFGLVLYAIGAFLFYPAAEMRDYSFFLFALFVIASGLAFLETSANPFITVLGPPETAERRLNLAQSFNPLGAITGVIIGRNFIFSGVEYTPEQLATLSPAELEAFYIAEAHAVQMPYVILGCIVTIWAFLICIAKFPKIKEESRKVTTNQKYGFRGIKILISDLKELIRIPHFCMAVIAQFCYVGAQVGIWSYLIRYVQFSIPGTPEKIAADYLTYSLIAFMIGRFVGTAIMKYIKPSHLLGVFAMLNVVLSIAVIFGTGYVGLYSLIIISFFMSIMFPTIFALGISGLHSYTKSGSSIIIMAIIGGAVITTMMGLVSDIFMINIAYSVPLICFIFISYFALFGHKLKVKN